MPKQCDHCPSGINFMFDMFEFHFAKFTTYVGLIGHKYTDRYNNIDIKKAKDTIVQLINNEELN